MLFVKGVSLAMALLMGAREVTAKAVFAHFLIGNANGNTIADWTDDITKAKEAHIDGFALNVASQDSSNAASIANAFQVANTVGGFKLFFSFDYEATGAWDAQAVINLIKQYSSNGAYYMYNNGAQPLVSTFEGPGSASTWPSIKQQTNAFFVPDWSSLGAQAAVNTGVVDGLFSWDAWPNGANDMTTNSDITYKNALNGKPYMMPVSPWFFTNLPGWSKNWLWRGDDMWFDRWQQVLTIQPELVEILTWNDFGESHYIGPIRNNDLGLFTYGAAPYNYASEMDHDGWRAFLPYIIDTYKNGVAPAVQSEEVTSWFRPNPSTSCSTGGTTGNTASQGQIEVAPGLVSQDRIFYSALLASPADVTITIGGSVQRGTWRNTPKSGSGLYHGNVPTNGATGAVKVTISRNGVQVNEVSGGSISTSCQNGIQNWNAWVGASPNTPVPVIPSVPAPASSSTSAVAVSKTSTVAVSSTSAVAVSKTSTVAVSSTSAAAISSTSVAVSSTSAAVISSTSVAPVSSTPAVVVPTTFSVVYIPTTSVPAIPTIPTAASSSTSVAASPSISVVYGSTTSVPASPTTPVVASSSTVVAAEPTTSHASQPKPSESAKPSHHHHEGGSCPS